MRPSAYEGQAPYVFISYAHKDTDRVFEIVNELERHGCRYWYDEGIAPGSEWPEDVAKHLNDAAMLMAFISPNSMQSENCRREINFALSRRKPFLSIHLEKTDMPLGMEMQLSTQQSILRYNYTTWGSFIEKILKCPDLTPCCGEVTEPIAQPQAPDISNAERELKLMELMDQAQTFFKKNEYTQELKVLLSGWDLGCEDAAYLQKLGRCYRRLGHNQKALEYYAKAQEIDPHDPALYGNIGVAYAAMGQNEKAKPYYERFFAMTEENPASVSAYDTAANYANYALCIGSLGDMKGAKKNLKIAKDRGYSQSSIDTICQRLKIDPKSIEKKSFLWF